MFADDCFPLGKLDGFISLDLARLKICSLFTGSYMSSYLLLLFSYNGAVLSEIACEYRSAIV